MGIMNEPYGGAAGFGAALVSIGQQNQRAWQDQDLQRQRQEAEEQKALRLLDAAEQKRQSGSEWDWQKKKERAGESNDMEAENLRSKATVQAEVEANKREDELSFKSDNLKDLTRIESALARARHIGSPGDRAQLELAQYNLQQAKELGGLRSSLAKAKADGDAVAATKLQDQIEALGFTGKGRDVSAFLSAATQAGKLAADPMTPEDERKGHLSRMNALFEQAGITPQAPMQDVVVAGKVVGQARTVEEARAMTERYRSGGQQTAQAGSQQQTPRPIMASPSYNEAGYLDVQTTIDGAQRGDAKAKALLFRMMDEGGLSARERVQINELSVK